MKSHKPGGTHKSSRPQPCLGPQAVPTGVATPPRTVQSTCREQKISSGYLVAPSTPNPSITKSNLKYVQPTRLYKSKPVQEILPDLMVPIRPNQLVKVIERREVAVAEEWRAGAVGPLQLLSDAVVSQLVQHELNLQHRLQPPLLQLLPQQLLPPRSFFHRLLNLRAHSRRCCFRALERFAAWYFEISAHTQGIRMKCRSFDSEKVKRIQHHRHVGGCLRRLTSWPKDRKLFCSSRANSRLLTTSWNFDSASFRFVVKKKKEKGKRQKRN